MIDAVLSYHMNPQTCGVAKFNQQLAQRLGVPMFPLVPYIQNDDIVSHALVSVKLSETPDDAFGDLSTDDTFDVFLHDWTNSDACVRLVGAASKVYAANGAIAKQASKYRSVAQAFCPSTVEGNAHRGAYRVLVFGMAHKLNLPRFETLKAQLDDEHPDYTIELSTAVHEGSPWDEAITDSVIAMRSIFGSRLRVLGFLNDDALARELTEVNAVACYFTPALRANNTSYWAAVDAGKTIYTNRDEFSPKEGERKTWDDLIGLLRA